MLVCQYFSNIDFYAMHLQRMLFILTSVLKVCVIRNFSFQGEENKMQTRY